MDGKKHLGCSSPAKPAFITPEPYTVKMSKVNRVVYKKKGKPYVVNNDWLVSQHLVD